MRRTGRRLLLDTPPNPAFAAISSRYEGGHVPIFSAHASANAVRHSWAFRNAGWCEACREPISSWLGHVGRMDHNLLDLHYSAIADYKHRKWNPEEVIAQLPYTFGLRSTQSLIDVYGQEDHARRVEISTLISFLGAEEIITLGDMSYAFTAEMGGGLQGTMVQHQMMITPLLHMFPNAAVANLSDLTCFMFSNYHFETIYDLCSLSEIDEAAADEAGDRWTPFGEGRGKVASQALCAAGAEAGAEEGGADEGRTSFSQKGRFLRGVMGQLRWCMQGRPHPAFSSELPEWVSVIGDRLLRLIICEIVYLRSCEYSVRMEPVWREQGFEHLKQAYLAKSAQYPGDEPADIYSGARGNALAAPCAPQLATWSTRVLGVHGDDRYEPAAADAPRGTDPKRNERAALGAAVPQPTIGVKGIAGVKYGRVV
jgi:hypothetical protein